MTILFTKLILLSVSSEVSTDGSVSFAHFKHNLNHNFKFKCLFSLHILINKRIFETTVKQWNKRTGWKEHFCKSKFYSENTVTFPLNLF